MHYPLSLLLVLISFASLRSPTRFETWASSELEPPGQTARQIKWPTRTIEVAFSTSLQTPGANIKTGSDVVGAARRALARWSSITNLKFVVTWSSVSSVSPAKAGDGISLITIADTPENQTFN